MASIGFILLRSGSLNVVALVVRAEVLERNI